MHSFDEFLAFIRAGDYDHRLDEVSETLRLRYKARDANAALEFTVGTRVVVPPLEHISPKYMHGQRGTVEGFTRSGKVKVRFDRSMGTVWTWPASLLLPQNDDV